MGRISFIHSFIDDDDADDDDDDEDEDEDDDEDEEDEDTLREKSNNPNLKGGEQGGRRSGGRAVRGL